MIKKDLIWCTVADENAKYGKYSIAGANAGRKFGSENAEDQEKLGLINDYDWLTGQFRRSSIMTSSIQERKARYSKKKIIKNDDLYKSNDPSVSIEPVEVPTQEIDKRHQLQQ